ncbi:MAG: translation initiation factor IF-3 [Candidatus Omnitrophica bacterium]|nr:translation initiation factor IF-3 [Candidatus Omnitrophota bacterium]
MNQEIRASKVRLIDEEGNQLGVFEIRDAAQKAKDAALDLVEVSPTTVPPVCRIMDYGKFKYDQEKKKKVARKKQHVVQTKEMRFKPRIEENDYQVKIKHIKEFLEAKDKVRITLRFRGREVSHQELGEELLNRVANDIAPWGEIDGSPKVMGKTIIMNITPKK